ncbi:type II toxin-antitoxin system RelE/ParE family toxin [Segetibacter sp.]|uniref:type II toxin-antitoxin system RelE/ParE family toxin n=1 Tax=Segetibacter sp. TaxID=2231182 RepID=UPI003445B42D
MQKISKYPEVGKPVIITKKVIVRQILVFKYTIFYRVPEDEIEILSIYHSSRLIENNPGLQRFF